MQKNKKRFQSRRGERERAVDKQIFGAAHELQLEGVNSRCCTEVGVLRVKRGLVIGRVCVSETHQLPDRTCWKGTWA